MENRNDKTDIIDLKLVFKNIMNNKKLFIKTLSIVFVLSCIYIFSIPRFYTSSLSLAPELGSNMNMGSLGSIASSFGLDINDMQGTDAISPLLYPDLMEDNGFVTSLFPMRVKSNDGNIDCTYYDYLAKHQKVAWYKKPIIWVTGLFTPKDDTAGTAKKSTMSPYNLTKKQSNVAGSIRENIKISVDKKTAVITISVKAQDALICKTMADSVKGRLQTFITNYRTNKARIDEQYYKKLTAEAKADYEKARQKYGAYSDSNMDVILESIKARQADLENDMQLKYNTYSTLMTQYQAAKAKVQERTPAFTVVKGASVPIKPAGPKRLLFIIGMCFLATIMTAIYITYKKKLI